VWHQVCVIQALSTKVFDWGKISIENDKTETLYRIDVNHDIFSTTSLA